jgi:hypothetical protein
MVRVLRPPAYDHPSNTLGRIGRKRELASAFTADVDELVQASGLRCPVGQVVSEASAHDVFPSRGVGG